MDKEQLLWALTNGISLVPADRERSWEILQHAATFSNYTITLFELLASGDLQLDVRLMALTQFKRVVENHWQPVKYVNMKEVALESAIPAGDKEAIRGHLLDALVHCPPEMLRLLSDVFHMVAVKDFPHAWPGILEGCVEMMRSNNLGYMHGGLYALLLLMGKFQYMPMGDPRRQPLDELTGEVMGLLLDIMMRVVDSDEPEVAQIQALMFKMIYKWLQLGVPRPLQDPRVFEQWMTALLAIYTRDFEEPEPVQRADPDERARYGCWKARKHAIAVFSQLLNRYGAPPNTEVAPFCEMFMGNYVAGITNGCLQVISKLRDESQWLPRRIKQLTLQFLSGGVRYANAWRVIRPHATPLCCEVLFRLLMYNEADDQTWVSDPTEFVRREFDVVEEYYSPRKTAEGLLYDICRIRGQKHLLAYMDFLLNGVLREYNSQPPEQRNVAHKYAALLSFSALASPLKLVVGFTAHIDELLVMHVLPELCSPYPFLRARACHTFSQYWDLQYKNEEAARTGLRHLLDCLAGRDLIVRVIAGCSLRYLHLHQQLAPLIAENLRGILHHLFEIMNLIDCEELISTLESLVNAFEDEVKPFAVDMASALTENILRMTQGEDEDEESTALAASEALRTLHTVMSSVAEQPTVYHELEEAVWPLLDAGVDENYHEYFDEVVRLISYLTFYMDRPSERLWSLFPRLVGSVIQGWSIDSLDQIVIPIDNYISSAPDVFVGQGYMRVLMQCFTHVVGDMDMTEKYTAAMLQMIEVPIHNCRGHIDDFVPEIIYTMTKRASGHFDLWATRILLFDIYADLLYYNPVLTLRCIEETNHTGDLFDLWFQVLPRLKRSHDLKMHILGFSAILAIPSSDWPPVVRNGIRDIVGALLELGVKICRNEEPASGPGVVATVVGDSDDDEEDEGEESSDGEVEEDDEGDFVNGIPTDEDVPNMTEFTYQEERLLGYSPEDLFEDELDDEDTFTTPLDEVDEIMFMFEQFEAINSREGAAWSSITTTMDQEQLGAVDFLQHQRESRQRERAKEMEAQARER